MTHTETTERSFRMAGCRYCERYNRACGRHTESVTRTVVTLASSECTDHTEQERCSWCTLGYVTREA